MGAYWVPKTPDREERIFGGILSLRQAVYLLVGLLVIAGVERLLPVRGASPAALVARLVVAIPAFVTAAAAAFLRLERFGLNVDEAAVRWWRWRRTCRRYVGRRVA